MAIVKTVQGNLLDMFKRGDFKAIAHGCNCFRTMGAGIAGQIAAEFPEAVMADLETSLGYALKLGTYSIAETPYGRIFNLYSQYRPGVESPRRLADSIYRGFATLDRVYGDVPGFVLGIPKIGCGIAGGKWSYMKDLIDMAAPKLNIVVVEYQP